MVVHGFGSLKMVACKYFTQSYISHKYIVHDLGAGGG